jgi:hypothetical protein
MEPHHQPKESTMKRIIAAILLAAFAASAAAGPFHFPKKWRHLPCFPYGCPPPVTQPGD